MTGAGREPGEQSEDQPGRTDYLTIALYVYFVSLIVLVAALLALPALA